MSPSAAFPPSLTCAACRSVSPPLPLCCCSLSFFCCLAHRYSLQAPPRRRVLPTPTPSPSGRRTQRGHHLAGLFLCHARRCGRPCPRERAEPAAKAADKPSRLVGPSVGKGRTSRTSAAVYQGGSPPRRPSPPRLQRIHTGGHLHGRPSFEGLLCTIGPAIPVASALPPPTPPHPLVLLPHVGDPHPRGSSQPSMHNPPPTVGAARTPPPPGTPVLRAAARDAAAAAAAADAVTSRAGGGCAWRPAARCRPLPPSVSPTTPQHIGGGSGGRAA